jgi:putative flippase GtrA
MEMHDQSLAVKATPFPVTSSSSLSYEIAVTTMNVLNPVYCFEVERNVQRSTSSATSYSGLNLYIPVMQSCSLRYF